MVVRCHGNAAELSLVSACGNVNSTNMAEWRHTSSLLMRREREGGREVIQRVEETKRGEEKGEDG